MITLIVATGNSHKVSEIQSILGDGFKCHTLKDLDNPPEPVEDGDTFEANATIKAVSLADWLLHNHPGQFEAAYVLADDSGLEVDALDGAPGVYSARFANLDTGVPGNSPDADNNAKLLRLLADVPTDKKSGRFRCVLSLITVADGSGRTPKIFDGICEGQLKSDPSGTGGFGYDPLFIPDGYHKSFAELGEEIKNTLSHRARAVAKLKAHFSGIS